MSVGEEDDSDGFDDTSTSTTVPSELHSAEENKNYKPGATNQERQTRELDGDMSSSRERAVGNEGDGCRRRRWTIPVRRMLRQIQKLRDDDARTSADHNCHAQTILTISDVGQTSSTNLDPLQRFATRQNSRRSSAYTSGSGGNTATIFSEKVKSPLTPTEAAIKGKPRSIFLG